MNNLGLRIVLLVWSSVALAYPADPYRPDWPQIPLQLNESTIFLPTNFVSKPTQNTVQDKPRACQANAAPQGKSQMPIASLAGTVSESRLGDGWSIRFKVDYDSDETVNADHLVSTICSAWDDSTGWPLFQYVWPDPQTYSNSEEGWPEQISISGFIDEEERLEWGWLAIMLSWIVTFIGNNQYDYPNWKPENITISRNIPGKYAADGKTLGHLTTKLAFTNTTDLTPARRINMSAGSTARPPNASSSGTPGASSLEAHDANSSDTPDASVIPVAVE